MAISAITSFSETATKLPVAAFAGGLIVACFTAVVPVQAQSSVCIQLQNQLSALNFGGTRRSQSSPRYRQYDRAVKDQRAQINKTRRMARRNGCSASFFGQRNSSTCGRILASLDQMSANLASLEQERRRLAPRGTRSSDGDRRAVIRAMNQRGCFNNNARQRTANTRPRNRSLIEQIFGLRTYGNDGRRTGAWGGEFERPDLSPSSRYNTYRTMCVRKKDGYYFPVSFSTTPDRFEFDESVCQAKCPGTDVALYYHAMPEQDSEDMVSFRGQQPYADLPSAFAYRKKFDPEATCRNTSGNFQEIAGANGEHNGQTDGSDSILPRIGTPIFRSDRGLDPETIANQKGLFDEAEIARLLRKPEDVPTARTVTSSGRNVRVVGPAFYPVQ